MVLAKFHRYIPEREYRATAQALYHIQHLNGMQDAHK